MGIHRRDGGDASPRFWSKGRTYKCPSPTSGPNICIILSFSLVSSKNFLVATLGRLHSIISVLQVGPKIVSYRTLSISSLNIDQFSQFFSPVDTAGNLLLTHWHAHHTYYVATLPCKTYIPEKQQYHTVAGCNFCGYGPI